jgi:hypothetical protein
LNAGDLLAGISILSSVEEVPIVPKAKGGKLWGSLGTMPVLQDNLFSPARMVERTLASGTVIRLKLEPLSGKWVRVLEYHRKALGEGWKRVRDEEGRTLRYEQLKLSQPFHEVFSVIE